MVRTSSVPFPLFAAACSLGSFLVIALAGCVFVRIGWRHRKLDGDV
jgi:hypothetical protein